MIMPQSPAVNAGTEKEFQKKGISREKEEIARVRM